MPLSFLLDENLPARLERAVQRHNREGEFHLDVVRVGDLPDLPLRSDDPTILIWCEQAGRILVTEDKNTMPGYLQEHLDKDRHSPGVFLIRPNTSINAVLEFLVLVSYASQPEEWQDRIEFVP